MSDSSLSTVGRATQPGLFESVIQRPGCQDLYLTATPRDGESPEEMFTRLADRIAAHGATIVSQKVFHFTEGRDACLKILGQLPGGLNWPITWLEESNGYHARLAGTVVHAVRGPQVASLPQDGRPIGCLWSDGAARHLVLGDLRDTDTTRSNADQTQFVLEQMASALQQADMSFAHVYRTWFWNDDILGWYDDFNRVRTAFYKQSSVFEGVLPASTGIGAANPHGAALTAGLIAMDPLTDDTSVQTIPSPLQSSACDYGSSFSRAVEVSLPGSRTVYVSGTASIDRDGNTVHLDDIDAQIDLTMRVVHEILTSRGMDWSDVTRSLSYVRKPDYAKPLAEYFRKHNLQDMPAVVTNNVVCRDDLLFEIEVDAVVAE
jgi:enamine deaminase RidA (YjgF/YER057c/UK114 family)